MRKNKSEQKIPCGRTEADKHLCCKRKHKWYNTKLKIENIKLCNNPIKYKQIFRVQSSIYCKYCGSIVELASGKSLFKTILEYFCGPWL